jgi:hypothetical protein
LSNVLTKKPTEADETLEEEPPAHYTCPICTPELHFGIKAVCGAELLGIDAPSDVPTCERCTEIWEHHMVDVHGYPKEWLE